MNLAVQTSGKPEALRACQNTPRPAEDLTNGRTSVLRCEAIEDQTDTQKVRVTRHCQTLAGDCIVVARAGSIAWKHAGGCVRASAGVAPPRSEQWRERVAPPQLMGGSSRTVLTSKHTSQILEQIGTGAEARMTSGKSAICETCEGKQIKNGAEPDNRRIDSGGTP